MSVAIPPEFETFARERIAEGIVGSEEEAVAVVLRDYLDRIADLRALVDPALTSLARGENVDGAAFMSDLIAETQRNAKNGA